MRCTKPGIKKENQKWTGSCINCKAEFEATRSELKVESCPREHYEFANVGCTECSVDYKSVTLHPVKE